MENFNIISDEEMIMKSNVVKFYNNRNVFITGATGFLGKVLIEKLLRSCPNLKNIYILIRVKRNKSPKERFQEMFKEPVFDLIRKDDILLRKVKMIEGDIAEKNLGMSEEDFITIIKEVSVIFHVAATVKFDEPLRTAIKINVVGTKNVVDLSRKLQQLAALVHVSTAYANCDRDEIDEHIYPVDMNPENLIEMANWLDQDTLQELKNKLLASRPNTYTYTKALAEWLLVKIAKDLPIVVCRPSIVTASWREPFAGWIDNINGPTGVILGTGKGLIRSMFAEPNFVADLIPVDTVTNLIVLLAWFAYSYQNLKQLNDAARSLSDSVTESDSVITDGESLEEYAYRANLLDSELNHEGVDNNLIFQYQANGIRTEKICKDSVRGSGGDRRSNGSGSSLSALRRVQASPVSGSDDGYGSTVQFSDAKATEGPSTRLSILSSSSTQQNSTSKTPGISLQDEYREEENKADDIIEDHEPLVGKDSTPFEYKLKQFRHNTQMKLAAKNLPEEIADVPVFHCTSGGENPITWGRIQILVVTLLAIFPSLTTYRYPCGSFTNNKFLDSFYSVTLHYIPAYIIDFLTQLFGGKAQLVRIFRKFDQAANVLMAFTSKQWKFNYDNRQMLVREIMSEEDKCLFNCDIKDLDWSDYFSDYVLGVRKYILKEPSSNLAEARKHLNIIYYRNTFLQLCLILSALGSTFYLIAWFTTC